MRLIQIWCGTNLPPSLPGADVRVLLDSDNPIHASDVERFRIASETPDMVYADFDCDLLDGFEQFVAALMPGLPYFAFHRGLPDNFLFAVNGCCDFFKQLLLEAERRKLQPGHSWNRKLLRDKIAGEIPGYLYNHRFDTLNKTRGQGLWQSSTS